MAEIEWYAQAIQTYDIPSDGLVLCYCDLAYSASLGLTAKFRRDSIAFKWAGRNSRDHPFGDRMESKPYGLHIR